MFIDLYHLCLLNKNMLHLLCYNQNELNDILMDKFLQVVL